MKTQSIVKSILLAAGFSAVALIGSAKAQYVLSANFDVGQGNYSGANASGLGGNYFNDIAVSNSGTIYSETNLKESDGTTTAPGSLTATLEDTDYIGIYDATAPNPNLLFGGFAYSPYNSANVGSFTFGLSGLKSTDVYNLYLYSENGTNYSGGGTFTINGTPLTATNTGADSAGFVNGGNYVEFAGLTGSSTISADIAWNSVNADDINGFTLVDTTMPAEIPEPSTMALIGLGALGLAFLVRRHRTA